MTRPLFHAFDAVVTAVEDLSPALRRIVLGGEQMRDFATPTPPLDQRFKIIVPPGGGEPQSDLAALLDEQQARGVSWYQAWLQVDPQVRGVMRTYTVRAWREAEGELVVDMVLHADEYGQSGPASRWAQSARVGSHLQLVGRSRREVAAEGGEDRGGGYEFQPGGADHLLLVGDETAVPAVLSILESLEGSAVRGTALLEVPTAADELPVRAPEGIEVRWLPREGAPYGSRMVRAVEELFAAGAVHAPRAAQDQDELEDVDVDARILWDVPAAIGEAARGSGSAVAAEQRPFYAWIAGEAAAVKRIRRHLVREIGVDRRQVAFMGYWREGRAEAE